MSEPITLWDADGRQVTLVSPSEARRLVLAGELFEVAPSAVTVVAAEPAADAVTKRAGRQRKEA